MPLSLNTINQITRLTTRLDFLLSVPEVKSEKLPSECSFCHGPFGNEEGETEHTDCRPVQFSCGHVSDVKCLTWFVLSVDFCNGCPLCDAPILQMPEELEKRQEFLSNLDTKVAAALIATFIHVSFSDTPSIRPEHIEWLEDANREWKSGKHMSRTEVLYEGFLNHLDGDLASDDQSRAEAAETQAQELLESLEISVQNHARSRAQIERAASFRHHRTQADADRKVKAAETRAAEAKATSVQTRKLLTQAQRALEHKDRLTESLQTQSHAAEEKANAISQMLNTQKELLGKFETALDHKSAAWTESQIRLDEPHKTGKETLQLLKRSLTSLEQEDQALDAMRKRLDDANRKLGEFHRIAREDRRRLMKHAQAYAIDIVPMFGLHAITMLVLLGTAVFLRLPGLCAVASVLLFVLCATVVRFDIRQNNVRAALNGVTSIPPA